MNFSLINSKTGGQCLSISDYDKFSQIFNISKAVEEILILRQSDIQDSSKMTGSLLSVPLLIISMIETTAKFFGLSFMTFSITVIAVGYLLYKIVVPFNYIQDLDIPGSCYKRRDVVNVMRQMRKVGKKLPPPYPNGWYGVVESSDLKAGQIKKVEGFGESLAVFRGDSGQVHAVNAHCPHLGANMAVGGTVTGDCIQCPFHNWMFNGPSGKCVSIPGVDNVPTNAHVKTWETREVDGMIFVWYSSDDEPPVNEIPVIKEVADGTWKFMGRSEFIVPCHIQDIAENGADVAHLDAIHKDHIVAGKALPAKDFFKILGHHVWTGNWWITEDKHIAIAEFIEYIKLFGDFSMFHVDVTATQVGPTYVPIEFRNQFFRVVIIQTVVPIAPLVQKVVHRMYASPYMKPLANFFLWCQTTMLHRDVMMWSNKIYINQPMVVKTDKWLKAYRNWVKQFYSKKSITFEDAVKKMQSGDSLDW